MTTRMIIRIDPALKAKVNNLARIEGKSISKVVKELLENYVITRDIDSYIDNLWERIRSKLASGGVGLKDIKRVIREVRTKR